jgi:hypothetical protein
MWSPARIGYSVSRHTCGSSRKRLWFDQCLTQVLSWGGLTNCAGTLSGPQQKGGDISPRHGGITQWPCWDLSIPRASASGLIPPSPANSWRPRRWGLPGIPNRPLQPFEALIHLGSPQIQTIGQPRFWRDRQISAATPSGASVHSNKCATLCRMLWNVKRASKPGSRFNSVRRFPNRSP